MTRRTVTGSAVAVSEARKSLPSLIETAESQAVTLHRHGRAVAVVISPQRYEELLEVEEELADLDAYDEAMAESGPAIPWEQVKIDLGWV